MQDVPKWNPSPSCSSTASVKHGNACCEHDFWPIFGQTSKAPGKSSSAHLCALATLVFKINLCEFNVQAEAEVTHPCFIWVFSLALCCQALWSGSLIRHHSHESSAVTARLACRLSAATAAAADQRSHWYTCRCCSNCFTRSFRWCCTECAQRHFFWSSGLLQVVTYNICLPVRNSVLSSLPEWAYI